MKKLKCIPVLMVIASIIFSCSSDDIDLPYIVYKDASGKVFDSNIPIPVEINSSIKIEAIIGYNDSKSNHLNYEWKIDNGPFRQYTVFDGLNIYSLGGYNNLATEKVTMDITFTDELVNRGSLVTIRIRDMDSLSKELTFKVNL